jgi:hypothetical protein
MTPLKRKRLREITEFRVRLAESVPPGMKARTFCGSMRGF